MSTPRPAAPRRPKPSSRAGGHTADRRQGVPGLPDLLRRDPEILFAVRASLGFAVELASALAGMSFVRINARGEVDEGVPPWRCTPLEAATLVVQMRGRQESPTGLLASLQPDFLLRTTTSDVEDHLNRLGWHVW